MRTFRMCVLVSVFDGTVSKCRINQKAFWTTIILHELVKGK